MTKRALLQAIKLALKPLNPSLVEFFKYEKKSHCLRIIVVSNKFKKKNSQTRWNKLWNLLSKSKRFEKYLFIFEAWTPQEYERLKKTKL